jgi:hypothetical protein
MKDVFKWSPVGCRRVRRQFRGSALFPKRSFPAVIRTPAMIFGHLRRNPARGRKVLLQTIGIAVAATAVISVVLTVLALTFISGTADKLAAVGDVLVGATLLLAGIAAVVALLAYAVSTGAPDLQIRVSFNFSYPNNPAFKAREREFGDLLAEQFKQLTGDIQIRNNSSYSAKNPAVIVRLRNMAFGREEHNANWVITNFANTNGILAVQWDGGPAYSIHGNSTRRLPDLHLDKLHTYTSSGSPGLAIELLADGYRKEVVLPVDFTVDGQSQFRVEGGETYPEWM